MKDLEIQEQAEKSWEKINSELPNGVNPHAYMYGFKACAKWMQEQDKWISVEDRLPTPSYYKQQTVLLVKSDQGHYNYKATAWYGDNVGNGELNFHVFDDLTCINKFKHTKVTHWMEVPE